VTSGILSGLAGVYYAFSMGVIKPADFSFTVLLYCWTMLFVGGYQTMWGVVLGAPLLWAVTQLLPYEVAPFTRIIFGIMLMCTLLLRPEGILNRDLIRYLNMTFSRLRNRLRREPNHF
jgi:ABC-type branched-subunit amino acid transport system permease subunit